MTPALKTLDYFSWMDPPLGLKGIAEPALPDGDQYVLRMLVQPKYSHVWHIPPELEWLEPNVLECQKVDRHLHRDIADSWCYVTVRHGVPIDDADEWHLDGASMRTEEIAERNYVWTSDGFEYKRGRIVFPPDFDPLRHNLFTYAERMLERAPMEQQDGGWVLLLPNCLHRRRPGTTEPRTFIRITFVDIEIRDVSCTQNPLLPTDAYGRDPRRTFRDTLTEYPMH